MQCIDSLDIGYVKEIDTEIVNQDEIDKLQEDYIVVTVKNKNCLLKKYYIRGEATKKIMEVLEK